MARKSLKLTSCQKAWLAGIIDGEGCITLISDPPHNPLPNVRLRPIVSITNTNQKIIKYVMKLNRGKVGKVRLKTKATMFLLPCWEVYWRGFVQMKEVLESVMPYLVGKKEQAQIALRFIEHRQNRHKYHAPYTAYEYSLYKKIQTLNSAKGHHKYRGKSF